MNYKTVYRVAIFLLLFVGFFLLFYRMRKLKVIEKMLKQTKSGMENSARQRLLAKRSQLIKMKEQHSLFWKLEKELNYSGLWLVFPEITVEKWVVASVGAVAVVFFTVALWGNLFLAVIGGFGVLLAEWVIILYRKTLMLKAVDRNLLKFLDFLGNYSVSVGEVTGILNQVSPYLEEPLKSVLNQCYVEAKTTGDVGLALLSMSDKLEHPKFKEIVRNLEISTRYCSDFKALVHSGRRSVREYLRMGEERQGLLREAVINMLLLLGMSGIVLVVVDHLVEESIWHILFFSLPGRIVCVIVGAILLCMGRQIYKIAR